MPDILNTLILIRHGGGKAEGKWIFETCRTMNNACVLQRGRLQHDQTKLTLAGYESGSSHVGPGQMTDQSLEGGELS